MESNSKKNKAVASRKQEFKDPVNNIRAKTISLPFKNKFSNIAVMEILAVGCNRDNIPQAKVIINKD